MFFYILCKERCVREVEVYGYFLDAFVGIFEFRDDMFDCIFVDEA